MDKGLYRKHFALGSLAAAVILAALAFFLGKMEFHPIGTAVAVAVGILIGFLRVSGMKSAMNTVAKKRQAKKYLSDQSVRMGANRDQFLFSKTEKREKAQSK